ncbi:flagellar assembly protein T N-terminal domain-containing protein [Bermanella sp. R86510]|uniref:flagellar assembly protein T N-terminal domain-containing protein n=1 Tax=unclassified Bermanella TaxID=2627862 RepID=UPI0037CB4900
MKALVLILALLGVHWQVAAVEITAVGSAAVANDLVDSRDKAIRDALRQASLQMGGSIHSSQMLVDGLVTRDQVNLKSNGQFRHVRVLEEKIQQGIHEVRIRAEFFEGGQCEVNQGNGYRKAIAVAGFALQNPEEAVLGGLANIEQRLSGVLANSINGRQRLHAMDSGHVLLFTSVDRAPSSQNNLQRLTNSVELAKELGAQFVVSGVIRDLGMINPNADMPSIWDTPLSMVGLNREKRLRNFVLDVYVHDGISGSLMFQNTYAASGEWNYNDRRRTGFATPVYWKSDFGEKTKALISKVVKDLNTNLGCQPYMAKIIDTKGEYIRLDTGGSVGMRPGDELTVFRTSTFYNLDQQGLTQLHDTKIKATITQVQPRFAVAKLEKTASRFAIQREDVVVAW